MKSLDSAPLTDTERAAVREAARILKDQFPVEEIVLFGSKARGDFDAESDIDLLVLTSREVHWQERHAMIDSIYELELDRDVFMSLLILPRQDWKNRRLHGASDTSRDRSGRNFGVNEKSARVAANWLAKAVAISSSIQAFARPYTAISYTRD